MRGSIAASRKVKSKNEPGRTTNNNKSLHPSRSKPRHENLSSLKVGSQPLQRTAKIIRQSTISSFSSDVQERSRSPSRNDLSTLYIKHHEQYLPNNVESNGLQRTDYHVKNTLNQNDSRLVEPIKLRDSLETNGFCGHICKEKADSISPDAESSYSRLVKPTRTPSKHSDSSAEWRIRFARIKREAYQQAGVLIGMGVFLFAVGIMLSALHFAGYIRAQIVGPIMLACGLLTVVCSSVWVSIIKNNLKRREEVLTRTFSF